MSDTIHFTCNVCGGACSATPAQLTREDPTCPRCASSVRYRAIIHLISLAVFGRSLPLPEFPVSKRVKLLGMSDWPGFIPGLARAFEHVNTKYDEEPRLDLKAVSPEMAGKWDLIICSEVMEHVAPPVQPAFDSLHQLLRPGGTLIFTVPYQTGVPTIEHFPELHRYTLANLEEQPILVNRTVDGRYQVFDKLCFHGGIGSTLEMRIFGEPDLMAHFRSAGFDAARPAGEPFHPFGIHWLSNWSLPVVAVR